MIQVEDREAIRRAYFVEHKSIRAIARELQQGRNVIREALTSAEPRTLRGHQPSRFGGTLSSDRQTVKNGVAAGASR